MPACCRALRGAAEAGVRESRLADTVEQQVRATQQGQPRWQLAGHQHTRALFSLEPQQGFCPRALGTWLSAGPQQRVGWGEEGSGTRRPGFKPCLSFSLCEMGVIVIT